MCNMKNRTAPFFSAVIPVYNRRKLIKKSVNSVLEQSFRDFELIVVDDGSTDETPSVIKGYSDKRVRYIRKENSGPAAARNRGIEESRGDFIAFLDSDDWWLKDKLRETCRALRENPGYLIYHSQERWYRRGKLLNQKKIHAKPSGYVFSRCLQLCCISISTAAVSKSLFKKIGLFDEALPACEDYDFWLRASLKYPVYLIDRVLTEKEGGHGGRLSARPGLDRFRIDSIKKLIKSGDLNEKEKKLAFEHLKIKSKIYGQGCIKRGKIREGRRNLKLGEALL